MKALATLILFMSIVGMAQSQEVLWKQRFGRQLPQTDGGNGVIETRDDGFLAVGYSDTLSATPEETRRAYLVKTSSDGTLEWESTLSFRRTTIAIAAFEREEGGYRVFGWTGDSAVNAASAGWIWYATIDAQGNKISEGIEGEGNNIVHQVIQSRDGGFVVVGQAGAKALLMKFDSVGELRWKGEYQVGDQATGRSVRETTDGGYIVVGTARSPGLSDTDILLVRTDSFGGQRWARLIEESMYEEGTCIEETSEGGFLIAGASHQTSQDRFSWMVLARADSAGVILWKRTFPIWIRETDSLGINVPHMMRRAADGNYVIVGETGPDLLQAFLMKVDDAGEIRWQKILGSLDFSVTGGTAFQILNDGSYIITGFTWRDLLLMRVRDNVSSAGSTRLLPLMLDFW